MAGNRIYVQGSYIDVHDNEHVYLSVDKAEVKVADTVQPQKDGEPQGDGLAEPASEAEVLERLKPIFFNNEGDARLFLKEIAGMPQNDITDLVNRWVKAKRISDYGNSRKGVLWEILNDAGLYTKSRQNWNRRVF